MYLDTIYLPDSLLWEDETSWNKVAQSSQYSVTGALFIQESEKQTGRHITLVSSEDSSCYITRNTLLELAAKKDTPNLKMTLTFKDARTFTVMFRQTDMPLEVLPVNKTTLVSDKDIYILQALKFMEVIDG